MNTTLFAVGVLFFILPAFVARAAHFTTSFYKFSRLERAERFLPFFANEWQIILVYALAYSTLLHFCYWKFLDYICPASWPTLKAVLAAITSRADAVGTIANLGTYSVCEKIYSLAPFYFGLILFAHIVGKIAGIVRWNIVELYRQTVPNPWFYIIRPVGDDKITIIDVMTNVTRPSGNPILYRGIATGITNGRDGKPLAIVISKTLRLEPRAVRILRENDFVPVSIPGERFVILFDDIKNINVADVFDVEPASCFAKIMRCLRQQFEESTTLRALINWI